MIKRESQVSLSQETGGVDCSRYGVGARKSLAELFEEVEKGESLLQKRGGVPLRQLRVLNVFIISIDEQQVLVEDYQVRPNGAVRERGLPLSEKLLPGERWENGVRRAVSEELGSALPSGSPVLIDVDQDSHECASSPPTFIDPARGLVEEGGLTLARCHCATPLRCHRRSISQEWMSVSYPGLRTASVNELVEVKVQGLPRTPTFCTEETRPGGLLRNHWKWVDRSWIKAFKAGLT